MKVARFVLKIVALSLAAAAAVILTRLFRRMEEDGTPLPSRAGKK